MLDCKPGDHQEEYGLIVASAEQRTEGLDWGGLSWNKFYIN
jgi:hypothetical protein